MFDIGFAELFLLSLIGLLVLGPERLPAVARTIGGFVRKARISYYNLKRTVEAELAAAEAANPIKEAQKELESVQRQVNELKGQLDQNMTPDLTPGTDNHDPQRPQGELDEPEADDPEAPKALAHDVEETKPDEADETIEAVEAVEAEAAQRPDRSGDSTQ